MAKRFPDDCIKAVLLVSILKELASVISSCRSKWTTQNVELVVSGSLSQSCAVALLLSRCLKQSHVQFSLFSASFLPCPLGLFYNLFLSATSSIDEQKPYYLNTYHVMPYREEKASQSTTESENVIVDEYMDRMDGLNDLLTAVTVSLTAGMDATTVMDTGTTTAINTNIWIVQSE